MELGRPFSLSLFFPTTRGLNKVLLNAYCNRKRLLLQLLDGNEVTKKRMDQLIYPLTVKFKLNALAVFELITL